MGPPHFFDFVSRQYHFLGFNEECPQFCLGSGGRDKFNNPGQSENWTVPIWHGFIFGQKSSSACSDAAFALVVKSCVRVITNHYIAGAIEDTIGEVCGTIIEELIDFFVCALGDGGLLGANGTKDDK